MMVSKDDTKTQRGFCALLLDALASGLPLEQAAKRASDGVYEALLNG